MNSRHSFLDADNSIMEKKLRFVKNNLEENLNQYFGGEDSCANSSTTVSVPPREYNVVLPKPVSNKTRSIKIRNYKETGKWRDETVKKMLTYIQAHRNIGKPTVREYYNKLIKATKINATWHILQCKFRHLRITFQRAVAYFNSAIANGEDTTVLKDQLFKICPHYEQLSDIFPKVMETKVAVMDTTIDNRSQNATDLEENNEEPTISFADTWRGRRKKYKGARKWHDETVKKMLTYIQEHRNFEKPTAREYYNKLREQTKINAPWTIMKAKLQHLRATFQKAVAYSNSAVANGEDTTVLKDHILQICAHYEQLSDIFPKVKETKVAVMDTTTEVAVMDTTTEVAVMDTTIDNRSQDSTDLEENNEEPTISFADTTFAPKVKHTTLNQQPPVMDTSIKLTNFQEKQHELEKEKFEWAKEIEIKKIELEREKLSSEFQLKKLELEQNERIQLFEIAMKYKK